MLTAVVQLVGESVPGPEAKCWHVRFCAALGEQADAGRINQVDL